MTTEILLDQITSISKAGAYDAILPEYKRLQEVNRELLEALKGNEEDPPLYATNWLGTLLRICDNKEVYDSIVKSQSGDFDSVNMMLTELRNFVTAGNAAIKKAQQP